MIIPNIKRYGKNAKLYTENIMTDIAAAVIWQNGKILICRRPANKQCALLWEFPGGKQEKGETLEQTLARECMEELNIEISVGKKLHETIAENPGRTLRLNFFEAKITGGTLTKKEHAEIVWVLPKDLPKYDFCPSDKEFLLTRYFEKTFISFQ